MLHEVSLFHEAAPWWRRLLRLLLSAHKDSFSRSRPGRLLHRSTTGFCQISWFSPFLISIIHSQTRANALYCLLSQTVCSLMAQEKQMSASQPLVFLLGSFHSSKILTISPSKMRFIFFTAQKLPHIEQVSSFSGFADAL